jgi:hypothetical protein
MFLFQPQKSWCAKWQRLAHVCPGVYALHNSGLVTPQLIDHLDANESPLPAWVELEKLSRVSAE